jgi:hypothetical protein
MIHMKKKNLWERLYLASLLVEETRVPRENHWPVASHWQTLSQNVVSSTPRHERNSISHLYFSVISLGFMYWQKHSDVSNFPYIFQMKLFFVKLS